MSVMKNVSGSTRPETSTPELEALPGWELVSRGLEDSALGRETVAAMLVALASQRLARAGFAVPGTPIKDPGWRLYQLLVAEVGEGAAHARYNALRRRLLSFLRAV